MIQSFLRILTISVFLLLTHCTSISLKLPGATIESPQVAGKGKKELGPSLEPAREIEYSDAVNSRPPDLDNARALGATHSLLHQARFGLSDRFELGGHLGIDTTSSDLQTTYMLIGKFQIFGPTKGEAKAGDSSAGLFARVSYTKADGSGDQSVTFGPGGFPWSATVSAVGTMAGASFGHQVSDSVLLYFSGSYQNVRSSVKIDQQPADDLSDPGGSYRRDRDGRSLAYGAGLQIRLGKVYHFHLKAMQFEFYMDGIEDYQGLVGAGGFNFYW